MKISDEGLDLIKQFEGLRLTSYKDVVGIWTCGYGHIQGVGPETMCSAELADQWLREDVHHAENCVAKCINTDLTQNEFDALVSFVFNLGCGALLGSTLLKYINDGRMDEASEQFRRWNKAGGQAVAGLTRRREAEAAHFTA
jgi:GH24 family phage-related lysozyme (muramidase)